MSYAALKMQCPHCGAYGEHQVIHTNPKHLHWGKTWVALFERIAGQDLSYRERTKRCAKCGKRFDTVETWGSFLGALIKEVDRLQLELKMANARHERQKKLVEERDGRLREIAHIISRK